MPTSAFVTLLLRWPFTIIPYWQIAVSWLIVVLSSIAGVWFASKAFSVGALSLNQRLSIRRVIEGQSIQGRQRGHRMRTLTMRKFMLVARFEGVATTLRKPSFWFMSFLFPAIILGLTTGANLMAESIASDTTHEASGRVGYVDAAGYIQALPDDVDGSALVPFGDEASAGNALSAGDIDGYYVVSSDYVATGHLTLVANRISPTGNTSTRLIEYVLAANIAGDSLEAQAAVRSPAVRSTLLNPEPDESRNNGGFSVTYGSMFVFFFVLVMSSSMLLQSVGREKENRTAEVLLLSISPR